jgi:hypothetical protein
MTHIINWQATVASINGASLTGTNATQGGTFAAQLMNMGGPYTTAYNSSATIDTAKGTWLTSADAAWAQANSSCRYVESLGGGTPAAALAIDYYDTATLVARITAALGIAQQQPAAAAAELVATLNAQKAALVALWGPYSGNLADAYRGSIPVAAGTAGALTGGVGTNIPQGYGKPSILTVTYSYASPPIPAQSFATTVRGMEIPLAALITQATAFLTQAAYT